MKQIKLETRIKNLEKENEELRVLCRMAGVPLLIIYLPELVLKKNAKINKADKLWAKEKIKEYEGRKNLK